MSNDNAKHDEQKTRLQDAAKGFEVAMLITHDEAGALQARPMTIVSERGAIDEILIVTSKNSGPAIDVVDDGRASLVMQSSSAYVHLAGAADVFADQALAKKLWKPAWRVWFPDGPESPDLVFLRVLPSEGEYWDSSMVASLRYLFDRAKSMLSGNNDPQAVPTAVHSRVEL